MIEYNPYRDSKTGRFTNALGIVDSYSALTEKDIQIQRNMEDAERLNGKKPFPSNFYSGAKNSYEAVQNLLNTQEGLISKDFNFDDIDKTISLASSLYTKATNQRVTPACYNTAGTLSAIFDHEKLDYSVWVGIGSKDTIANSDSNSNFFNHAWVRRGNVIYDTYGNFTLKQTSQAPKNYKEVREFRFH